LGIYKEIPEETMGEGYTKNDLLFFPVLDWKSDIDKIKPVSSYFTKRGHRVFCFDTRDKNSSNMEDISDRLKIVNLNYNRLFYVDEIIKQNIIKNSILFVQDPSWFRLINYLKTKYNFKVIFNYLDELLMNNNIFKIIRISDIIITFSQASLNKVKEKNNKVIMINNDDLSRYVRGISKLIYS
jgi:hypothetical protein